ncbi:MAG: Vitamin B12 dependent methionine synthase activation subunit [Clostridia bacterium]|nr:Vitamin B12 dependent methionine synthase activation subunit [Clostridia bacterium]
MNTVFTKSFYAPPVNVREVFRYAGCPTVDESLLPLFEECMREAEDVFSYKVCYGIFDVTVRENEVVLPFGCVQSVSLSKNLCGCSRAVIFAATVGIGIDRLISKYGKLSPMKAVFMQALGAERIEALCDIFCSETEKEQSVVLKPRFSAGYGDLPLSFQKEIFKVLQPSRHIGLTLNESLLMSPSKSVTAIVGVRNNEF